MQVKLFEVRDVATFMPMMAVRLGVQQEAAESNLFLLRRAGYSLHQLMQPTPEPYVILLKLDGVQAHYDPFSWGSPRMAALHQHIIAHWNMLDGGNVLDIEFILGESKQPKLSERFGH